MGKRILGESEDEDSGDDEEEKEKSIVLNNGNPTDSNQETEGSTGSVTGGKPEGELSGGGSSENDSEEVKQNLVQQNFESSGCTGEDMHPQENGEVEYEIYEEKVQITGASSVERNLVSATEAEHKSSGGPASVNAEEFVGQTPNVLSSGNEEGHNRHMNAEANGTFECKSRVPEEAVVTCSNVGELEKPLDFNRFSSAVEMEV